MVCVHHCESQPPHININWNVILRIWATASSMCVVFLHNWIISSVFVLHTYFRQWQGCCSIERERALKRAILHASMIIMSYMELQYIYGGYSSFIWLYACAHMDDCEKSALDKNEWQFYNSLHFNLARCFPHFRRFVVRIFSTFATTVLNVQSFVCTQSNTHTHTLRHTYTFT